MMRSLLLLIVGTIARVLRVVKRGLAFSESFAIASIAATRGQCRSPQQQKYSYEVLQRSSVKMRLAIHQQMVYIAQEPLESKKELLYFDPARAAHCPDC